MGCSGIRFLAPIAAGFHPFPSRTRQLRPSAPMVVGPQGPSRVGQRQIITTSPPRKRRRVFRLASRSLALWTLLFAGYVRRL